MMWLPRFIARPLGLEKSGVMDARVKVLRDAAMDAQKSRLPQMAAALSYRIIFGILPVLALSLVVLKGFADKENVTSIINQVVSGLGLDQIVVEQPPKPADQAIDGNPSASTATSPVAAAGAYGPEPLDRSGRLDEWVSELIKQIETINVKAIGIVGVLVLFYAALAMIVEIERAFNQIFRVPIGRSWSRRLPNYTTLIVYAPLCLFATFYLGQQFKTWTEWLAGTNYSALVTPLSTVLAASQVFITTALLMVLYTVIPNTKVRFLPALGGAILAALAFEALKFGFVQYIQLSAGRSYARLYGSMALLPLFLLWVYLTWLIVLFGLQVTYQLQHGQFRTRATPLLDFEPTLIDPAAAVVVMNAAARGFAAGQPQTPKMLAKATGLGEGPTQMIVSRLADHNLLHRLERRDADRSAEMHYALARTPESITVGEILHVGFELAGGDQPESGSTSTLARVRRAQVEAMGDQTLADSADLPHALPSAVPDRGADETRRKPVSANREIELAIESASPAPINPDEPPRRT